MGSMMPSKSDLGAHRDLDLDRVVAELLLEHVRDALVVGARVVHLVDERDARARGSASSAGRR